MRVMITEKGPKPCRCRWCRSLEQPAPPPRFDGGFFQLEAAALLAKTDASISSTVGHWLATWNLAEAPVKGLG